MKRRDINEHIQSLRAKLDEIDREHAAMCTRRYYCSPDESEEVNDAIHNIDKRAIRILETLQSIRRERDQWSSRQQRVEKAVPTAPLVKAASPADQTACALRRASAIFDFVELVLPRRVATEEIGDAMEAIAALIRSGRPTWQVYVKVVATVFWLIVHAAHYLLRGQVPSAKTKI